MEEFSLLHLQLPFSCVEKQFLKGLETSGINTVSLSSNFLTKSVDICPHVLLFTHPHVDVKCQHIRTDALASFLCSGPSQCGLYRITVIMFEVNECSLALPMNVEEGKG